MVTSLGSIEVQHADCDDSSGTIFVEGEAPAGTAACLMPRRYRKQPDWWVIDLTVVAAPTEQAQRFRLSCPVEGLWGSEGIEVVGESTTVRIPRPEVQSYAAGQPRKLNLGGRIVRSSDQGASEDLS